MESEPRGVRRFAQFELDPANGLLRKDGRAIRLSPQPLKALAYLSSRPQQLVTREELRGVIWGDGTVVDFEHGLNTCIRQIRLALDDDAASPTILETVPKLGFRFIAAVSEDQRAAPTGQRYRLAVLTAIGALTVAVSVGPILLRAKRRPTTTAPSPLRYLIPPPEHTTFNPASAFLTVSPDGKHIAFVASTATGGRRLWVRSSESTAARELACSDQAYQPFWSPDSRSIAFGARGKLKRVDVETGVCRTLADGFTRTGTWSRGDVIVVPIVDLPHTPDGASRAFQGLFRLSAAGGPMTSATALDRSRAEIDHAWPQFLPDGRRFMYLAHATDPANDGYLYVGSLESSDRVRLFRSDSQAEYASGYLLFMRDDVLLAQPFDLPSLTLSGTPMTVATQVERNGSSSRGAFSVSETGVLAYRSAGRSDLVWYDRAGRKVATVCQPSDYGNPALSPDDRWLAVDLGDPIRGGTDIWVIELSTGRRSRLTSDGRSGKPLWSPDGQRILYLTGSAFALKAWPGPGQEDRFLTGLTHLASPGSWSADGTRIFFSAFNATTKSDLLTLQLRDEPKAVPLLSTAAGEFGGQLSPDGRWFAYVSNQAGRNDIYVRSYPAGDQERLISTNGGIEPSWRRDGKELYYLASDRTLMSVAVTGGTTFTNSTPAVLFPTQMSTFVNLGYTRNQYGASADGQRFLIRQPSGQPAPITVVVNWTAGLESRHSQ